MAVEECVVVVVVKQVVAATVQDISAELVPLTGSQRGALRGGVPMGGQPSCEAQHNGYGG